MVMRRSAGAPFFYPKCTPPLGWSCKFDSVARFGPPTSLTAAYLERRERKKDIRYRGG
jgi:hypothetical protein